MAMAFDSKFIDTSCVLKHNVDELLVGLTKQILLRQAQDNAGSHEKVNNFFISIKSKRPIREAVKVEV